VVFKPTPYSRNDVKNVLNCREKRLKEKLLVCQTEELLKQSGGPKVLCLWAAAVSGRFKVASLSALMVPPSKASLITVVAVITIIGAIIPSEDLSRTPSDLFSQFWPSL
jgi:hypothetical protein